MNLVKTHRIRVQTCSRKSAGFVWKRPSRSFFLRGLTNKQDKYISLVPKKARQNKPGSRNFSLRDLTKKIRQVYDWHKSSARTYWRRRRVGGQAAAAGDWRTMFGIYLIKCQKRKRNKDDRFFLLRILCSHTCIHATKLYVACLLSYIFPPRASVCQDCIGVSINDVLIFWVEK